MYMVTCIIMHNIIYIYIYVALHHSVSTVYMHHIRMYVCYEDMMYMYVCTYVYLFYFSVYSKKC